MKKSGAILCVLSTLNAYTPEKQPQKLSELEFKKDKNTYLGVQTNEAPVKYLLREASLYGQEVEQIICLCSAQCTEESIPTESIDDFLRPNSSLKGKLTCSTVDYFYDRISLYCESEKLATPTLNTIPYTPGSPDDSLARIPEYLESNFRISIDVTGGLRDAAILMTLAAQIVKFNAETNELGPIVYSNFADKSIVDQSDTFDLVNLVSAIESFTEHGNADKLCSFFNVDSLDNDSISQDTKNACKSMREFANSVALCRSWQFDSKIEKVHNDINNATVTLTLKSKIFDLANEGLLGIGNPLSIGYSSQQEVIEYLEESEYADRINFNSTETVQKSLQFLKSNNELQSSELLFLGLLETIHKRFIPESGDKTTRTLNAIRWCVHRKMILQALSLFREEISECLIDLGYFTIAKEKIKPGEEGKIKDLCCCCWPDNRGRLRIYDKKKYFNEIALINKTAQKPEFIDAIAWFHVLLEQRNNLLHVNTDTNKKVRKIAKRININSTKTPDIETLQEWIIKAVDCIAHLAEPENGARPKQ